MKICLPSQSKQTLGGGWTFRRTFEKYAPRCGAEIAPRWEDADIVLISGATMVERALMEQMKKAGKKIVLRVDNAPRNSRNRNTGTSRLYDFAQMADLVIYQSDWARRFLQPFLKRMGPVILNGADTDIFKPEGPAMPKDGTPQYLFAQVNRDETKQFHQSWYDYIMRQRDLPNAHLWLAGNFSPELQQCNFDFFCNERFRYLGVLDNPEDMAEILRGTDVLLLPYFNDACSQTLIEARLCSVKNIHHNETGGTPEIMRAPFEHLTAEYMTKKYIEAIYAI